MEPLEVISIGSAAAAAVKSCKALLTFFLCINIAAFELILDLRVDDSRIHIAKKEFFISDKLMAGIKITPSGSLPDIRFLSHSRKAVCKHRDHRKDRS